jgi:MFS transporter, FSR family, fosmidomycin resistance protein
MRGQGVNLPLFFIKEIMTTQVQILPATQPAAESEFQTGEVMTIVGGHFVNDTFTAFTAPLLPLIIERLSLSLTLAGSLWSLSQLPALLNPFIGYLGDRVSLRYLVIFSPALTATAMSLLGLAPSYATLAILLLMAGVGTAAFHATAPPMVARVAGKRLGFTMAIYSSGGSLGYTIAPLLVVWLVSTWTLAGLYPLMITGWGASLVMYWRLRRIPARPQQRQNVRDMLPIARRLFLPLLGVVVPRSFLLTALDVYLPTFIREQGGSMWLAGTSLAIWELAGLFGGLLAGPLSDRIGRRSVLVAGLSLAIAFMVIFLNVQGWLLLPVLLGLGFTAMSAIPVMMAMVQEAAPQQRALANGVFMFMLFLAGPLAAFFIGLLGDNFGLRAAFYVSTFVPLLALPMIFFLPKGR